MLTITRKKARSITTKGRRDRHAFFVKLRLHVNLPQKTLHPLSKSVNNQLQEILE